MRSTNSLLRTLAFALLLSPAAACTGGGSGETEGTDCSSPPSFSSIDWSSCTHCHASNAADRQGAPPDLDYDDYASASAKASQTASRVDNDTMPPESSDGPALTPEAKQAMIEWADCGAPE